MSQLLQSLTVIVPIVFVLAFGFFAGKAKAFGTDGKASIKTINHYVLTFALPPSLFVGTISVSKAQLLSEMVLFYSLLISLLIAFTIGLFIAKYLFKRNMIEASIAGLAASFSAGPFYGPALLGSIYGDQSGVAVSMIALVINVFIVPLATVLIKIDLGKNNRQQSEARVDKLVMTSICEAIFKTPFVWAPLLSFLFL